MMNLLEAHDIESYFDIRGGLFGRIQSYVKAVNGVSLNVGEGEIVSVVGESGCGKSTLGLALLGLQKIRSGSLSFQGESINVNDFKSWQGLRKDLQIIFQDPYTSLNPRLTIYESLSEPLLLHGICKKSELKDKVGYLLEQVELKPEMMDRFPHSFSGGQRQRICIARVLGIEPKLIVCDEIVSALDVSVQAQILELLLKLKESHNLSLLFISHDLAVVRAISRRIYVMYLGRVVEEGPSEMLFHQPKHPYTKALLDSIPTLDRSRRPVLLEGEVPSPTNLPTGCAFASRCKYKSEKCGELPQRSGLDDQSYYCHNPLN
ncbi:MAG: ATP-binding cassette domain-containing protein [Planctomycetes bacterium]|nr:ATP-binding cassette domain-containing protein [Planctomycetota bacterium]